MTMIEDGSGKGRKAIVDVDQRLHTDARSTPAFATYSDSIQHSYVYSTSLMTLTTGLLNVFWMQNQAATPIYIDRFWFFWDGGSTSYNRHAQLDMYGSPTNMGAPSANNTELVAGNGLGNLAFANNSPGSAGYQWDEGSGGITVPGTYGRLGSIIIPPNGFTMELGGGMILGNNNTLLLKAKGLSEAGELSIACTFFRKG